jgi:DNA-binding transcriptional LysR family regulator
MERLLDIAPLRSFVAVADCGGFQRAAVTLHLSQGAVSQHVRRLESAVGRQLVERQGRGSRFTTDGELLLSHARRILAVHDEALRSFVEIDDGLLIGSTEHAAAQLLPHLAAELARTLPAYRLRFRIDRGTQLREGLAAGRVDLALLLGPADTASVTENTNAIAVGVLKLTWYSAPGWVLPSGGRPLPIVAFDDPCVLRTRALDTLSRQGIPAVIGSEAIQLAGVQAAVRAGLGVALMATMGQTPEGLVARDDLPAPEPLALTIWPRQRLAAEVATRTAEALRPLLMATATI